LDGEALTEEVGWWRWTRRRGRRRRQLEQVVASNEEWIIDGHCTEVELIDVVVRSEEHQRQLATVRRKE
jgi:hypothetical protein